MRQNFIKATSISLIALFFLGTVFISNGVARSHPRDRSEFQFKGIQNKEALLKKQKTSNRKQRLIKREKENAPAAKSVASFPQKRTNRGILPPGFLFFESKGSKGDIRRLKRNFINVRDITPSQRNRLLRITGKSLLQYPRTRNVIYGFSRRSRLKFDVFLNLMLRRRQTDSFLLGYSIIPIP